MKPAPFAYLRPASVDEAVQMLAAGDAKVLAGGQSLVPILSMRLASPATLVDVNRIDGLSAIDVDGSGVRIGALTRHRALERDDAAYAANPLLRRALVNVAHPTIRNRGTTVGSLVHADPAAEMPAVLCLLGGSVEVVGAAGRRVIAADDFVVGPMESSVRADELAVAATFPTPPPHTGSAWLELSRRHGDYAMAGVGALVTLADDGETVVSARLALISVGLGPVLVDATPAVAGQAAPSLDLSGVGDLVDAAIDPETDIHATAEYRGHLARVLAARALAEAAVDAGTTAEAAA